MAQQPADPSSPPDQPPPADPPQPADHPSPEYRPSPAYRPSPDYPPSDPREPDWTTGQGIGFLVALPRWILVGLVLPAAIVGLAVSDTAANSRTNSAEALLGTSLLMALFGVIIAIPGTVVFNKCKRR